MVSGLFTLIPVPGIVVRHIFLGWAVRQGGAIKKAPNQRSGARTI